MPIERTYPEPIFADSESYDHDGYYSKAKWLRRVRTFQSGEYGTDEHDRLKMIAEEIQVRIKITKYEIYTVGELLYEAKQIKRGEFQQWVKGNFDFSYDTAYNFIRVYQCCLGTKRVLEGIKPSLLYKISAVGFPEELREWLFAQGNLDELTNRDLSNIVKRYDEGGFEAVEDVFENFAASDRYHKQVAYALDKMERAIRHLEKERERIKKIGWWGFASPTEQQQGHSREGTEARTVIDKAFEHCILHLHNTQADVWDRLNKWGEEAKQAIAGEDGKNPE